MYSMFSFDEKNVIMFDCGNGRPWTSNIYPHPQKQILIISTKIQSDYLLKIYCILYWFVIFDVFTAKALKVTAFTFGMCVEPSILRTRQFEDVWRKCHEIMFWRVLLKFVDIFLFWLILYKSNGRFTYRLKVFLHASSV
jgi:hypothetical protein